MLFRSKKKNFEELREIRIAQGTLEPEEGDPLPEVTGTGIEAAPDAPEYNRGPLNSAGNIAGLY